MSHLVRSCRTRKKGSPYSTAERRVPGLIPVLGSQPAGDVSHKPGGIILGPFFRTQCRPTSDSVDDFMSENRPNGQNDGRRHNGHMLKVPRQGPTWGRASVMSTTAFYTLEMTVGMGFSVGMGFPWAWE